MKKLIVFLFALASFYSNAQSNCANAAPFCAGSVSGVSGGVYPATTGTTSGEVGPNYDCNGLQASPISYYVPSPSWYYLQVGTSGSLDILIEGQQPNGTPGGDVDFVCWGPFSSLAGICNSLTANFNVDCSYSSSYTETLNIANAVAGQYYMIVITNFYNQPQNIVLNQYSGTGSTNCSLVNNAAICAGSSKTITIANSTSLTSVSFSIQPGGQTNSTGTFVVTPSVTTSYTTYISGLNGLGNPVSQVGVANITVNPQPFTAPTATQTTCTGTVNALNIGLTFNPPTPVPGYTVVWMPTPFGLSPSQTSAAGGILPGVYNYTVVTATGCVTSSLVTISTTPPSSFNIVPGGSVYSVTCSQPTVVLNGSEPTYSYTWSNGVTSPMAGVTTSFTAFSTGNWTVIGTNPVSGCVSSKTFTVVLNNTPPTSAVNPVNQSINCGPGAVATVTGTALSPTVNVSHVWYGPGGVPPTAPVGGVTSIYNPGIVGSNGTSTFVLTNLVNGCSVTKTVQVVSNAGAYPSFAVSSNSTQSTFTLGCTTRSVTDVNIINAQTTPLGGSVSYTILPPGFSGTNYTTTTANVYTINVPGTYTLIVKDNSNLCETRIPLPIVQNTFAPNIVTSALTRTLDCNIPMVSLQGTTTTQNVTYVWKSNSVPPSVPNASIAVNTTSAGASVSSATVIDVYTLTVVDASPLGNNCPSSTVVTMYQNTRPPRAVIVGAVPLTCLTSSVNLTNDSKSGVLPNTFFGTQPIIGLLWEGPSPQLPQSTSSTYQGFTAGIYTMTAQDLNNGCTSKTTTTIGDNRVYPTILTNTSVPLDCGATITGVKLSATVLNLTPSGVTAQWFTPEPTPNVQNPNTLTLTTNGVGRYSLVVTTNSNGCRSQVYVIVTNGVLTSNFTSDQTSGYAPLTVNFTNNSASSNTATASSSITSVWSFGNGTTRTTTTNIGTSATYAQPGTYTVTMFSSKGSCVDTFVQVIKVDIPSKLEVPNVFTPNGDGTNDIFFIKTANLTEINALIYDRWGNKIYELTTEKGNIAWDGKSNNGKEAPDGTYFYIIKATGRDGQTYDNKGTVSLYR